MSQGICGASDPWFVLDLDVVVYAGTVLLVAASIWNSWPNRTPATSCGPEECVTDKVPA